MGVIGGSSCRLVARRGAAVKSTRLRRRRPPFLRIKAKAETAAPEHATTIDAGRKVGKERGRLRSRPPRFRPADLPRTRPWQRAFASTFRRAVHTEPDVFRPERLLDLWIIERPP
jgi:hypothetical protein